jgi:hypothetical protein
MKCARILAAERYSYSSVGDLVASSAILQFVALMPEAAARAETFRRHVVSEAASDSSPASPIAQALPLGAASDVKHSESFELPASDDMSIAVAPAGAAAYVQRSDALMRARPIEPRALSSPLELEDPTYSRLSSGAEHAAAVLVARGQPTQRCLLILHVRMVG